MNKKVILIIVISILLLSLTIFKLKSNKEKAEKQIYIHDFKAEVLVDVTKPNSHQFMSSYSYLGTFEPIQQNLLGSDSQGKIIKVFVNEGDKVISGQSLAKVDDQMLQLQLNNADLAIEGKKNDENRNSKLNNEKVITDVQLEKTQLDLKSNEINKKIIQEQIKKTNISSPFSGIITKKLIDLGSVIGPGTPLFEITDISSLKLIVNIPERDIKKINLNQKVNIHTDINKNTYEGVIKMISVQADQSHNFKVQINVNNKNQELLAGMYGTVSLKNSESKNAISIPRKALIGSIKKPQVYIVKNGKAYLTSFNAGISDSDNIEVISGLDSNDLIVVKGQVNLTNGSNVKIK